MTTVTTTEAAAQAHVTVATIRAWCRRSVIAAAKVAGRWVIDNVSLDRRIAIGARRARKQAPVIRLERSTDWRAGRHGYVVTGPADTLRAAYQHKTPVTLTGDFDGDRLYLGTLIATYGDNGIVNQPVALLDEEDNVATYAIDTRHLDDAPRFLARIHRDNEELDAADARQAAADNAYLDNYYD
ncbi:hypothetical protein ACIP80_33205 [Streptomyces sp. NPDC088555]|uniref:hypothetical protein n=1 Tax=Streptomyces sp. NPDC088555 TaxID=3365866 RepID=UPI00380D892B